MAKALKNQRSFNVSAVSLALCCAQLASKNHYKLMPTSMTKTIASWIDFGINFWWTLNPTRHPKSIQNGTQIHPMALLEAPRDGDPRVAPRVKKTSTAGSQGYKREAKYLPEAQEINKKQYPKGVQRASLKKHVFVTVDAPNRRCFQEADPSKSIVFTVLYGFDVLRYSIESDIS